MMPTTSATRRRGFSWRTVTAVWGLTHIALAVALTVIVTPSSPETALTFNRTVPWVLAGALLAWAFWWGERLRAQKPGAED